MRYVREHMATIVAGVLVVAVLAVAFALFWPRTQAPESSLTAVIHSGDGGEQRLPLSVDTSVEVVTSLGHNTVVVKDGAAHIEKADCPNGSCMQQQPISQPGQQLICLPHKLWVEVIAGDGTTSELNPGAVTYGGNGANSANDVDVVAR